MALRYQCHYPQTTVERSCHSSRREFGLLDGPLRPEFHGVAQQVGNTLRQGGLVSIDFTISADHVRAATASAIIPQQASDRSLREYAAALLAAAQRGEIERPHNRLLEAAEQEMISQAIQLTNGNQLQAAPLLGISRLTLREKLARFGLRQSATSAT